MTTAIATNIAEVFYNSICKRMDLAFRLPHGARVPKASVAASEFQITNIFRQCFDYFKWHCIEQDRQTIHVAVAVLPSYYELRLWVVNSNHNGLSDPDMEQCYQEKQLIVGQMALLGGEGVFVEDANHVGWELRFPTVETSDD